ncbi:MAG: DNA alkylation repair protein [Azospirillaceae bacterium]|nr:DNA alkylation repair protein [Azospirillaceae bacterium]
MTDAAPALKEIFNPARLAHIAAQVATVYPSFDRAAFLALASANLVDLSIMQRLRQVASSLVATLPDDFTAALDVLYQAAPHLDSAFASMALPEYAMLRAMEDFDGRFDIAMKALAHFTRFGSSEFAIRPFLRRDLNRTLAVMTTWASDSDEHVRRLASEGCRPRLPWSFRLDALVADPSPTAPILDALKADPSAYVRKSVANHLNDITKDHPDWVLDRLATWPLQDRATAWIARHALRTLIKAGNRRALAVMGAGEAAQARVADFRAAPTALALGGTLALSADLASTATTAQRLVVDYAVHYVKKNGSTSRKVFKWKVLDLAAGATARLALSQVVRDFTTRTHNAGRHRVELLVNGACLAESHFDLMV